MFHSVLVCGLVCVHRPQIVVVYTFNICSQTDISHIFLARCDVDLEEKDWIVIVVLHCRRHLLLSVLKTG